MPSSVDLADRPVALQGIASVQPAGYSAIEFRRAATIELPQEGVVGAGDFKVTPGAAAKTLAVAAGESGIDGDSTANQGRYYQRGSAAQTLDLAVAPDVTNPRIDQLVLEIKDDAHDASGLNVGRLRVVSGVASAGATLDNRAGAAALPATCIRLADVLVPAGHNAVFVAATHVRDRRPWARGAYVRLTKTNADTSISALSAVALDAAALSARVECSGVPLRLRFRSANWNINVAAGNVASFGWLVDGALLNSQGEIGFMAFVGNNQGAPVDVTYDYLPPPGSHLVAPAAWVNASTVNFWTRAAAPGVLTVEERVVQDALNT